MKNLFLILGISFLSSVNAAVPGCYKWDTKCIEKEYARQQALDEEIRDHRRLMQQHIDAAVESERPVMEQLRNKPQISPEVIAVQICRQMAIDETVFRFGYLNSKHYRTLLDTCMGVK
ncbi:hypothetical protein vBAbaMPhT2_255 [Acinetobacter phage vB_AbaM_PhT2]|uniref:Uncharacterized protein n=1 Tax=Acinetobacter phage vB_AbaM_PhT2 TaxID=2690230 RepID=A0A6B9SZ24_9CAUD|nr:hypothetical protein HYQ24_gp183 [Acinetobacter phage vB_AbaM_PhT2]QHJ75858.1 hypothetical protein vBAbaMPhT2_255 [Acinetobacter phage vB_AbaM_PhT2]